MLKLNFEQEQQIKIVLIYGYLPLKCAVWLSADLGLGTFSYIISLSFNMRALYASGVEVGKVIVGIGCRKGAKVKWIHKYSFGGSQQAPLCTTSVGGGG